MRATRGSAPGATVLRNGVIRRSAHDTAPAPAMAIRSGEIVAVGSIDRAHAAAPGARTVDLEGRTVLPAFIDSHTHFHRAALLRQLHLDFEALAPASITEVLDLVRRRSEERRAGEWIQGDSISPARLAERRLPDRHELDVAAPHHPVIIRGIGKHVVAANSAALALAGIDRDTPDPPGGRIERDASGEPSGILHERAKLRLDASDPDSVIPGATPEQRQAALLAGIAEMHRLGVAGIHEQVRQPEEAGDLAALHAVGRLGLRVRLYYRVHESPISLDWLVALGLRRGWGDDRLRVGGVKVSVDGWCIFRNAAVYEPYLGEPSGTGLMRIEPQELERIVVTADRAGLGVAVHAVGARAVDAALAAFDAAQPAASGPHRLEHAHLDVDARRLRRIRDLGLVLSAQPSFLAAYLPDWELCLDRARIDRVMPLGSAHRLGIPVIINSDLPSGPSGPLRAIAAAVSRAAGKGSVGPGEALAVADAWAAHSSLPAEVTGDTRAGRLEPGRRADLVVLGHDPLAPGAAMPTAVGATMVDGEVVHDPGGWLS